MIQRLTRTVVIVLAALAVALRAGATELTDPTFSGAGFLTLPWTSAEHRWQDGGLREEVVAVANDGGVFIAHEGTSDLTVVRLDGNGVPVASYVGGGVTRLPIASVFNLGSLYIEPDGSILLGGARDLIRVDGRGFVDSSFGDGGRMRIPFINDSVCAGARVRRMFPTTGGAWVVVGSQTYIDPFTLEERGCTFLARVRANGTTDLAYGTQGNTTRPGLIGFDAAMLADGTVEVIGRYIGATGRWVERFTPEGKMLDSFGTRGSLMLAENGFPARAVDGRILADGSRIFVADSTQPTLVLHRYRADNTFDPMFAGVGRTVIALRDAFILRPRVLAVPDGGFIIRGRSSLGAGVPLEVFYKIDARGLPDERFGEAGYARHIAANWSGVLGWAIQPDGYVVFSASSYPNPGPQPPVVPPMNFFTPVNAHATRIQAVPDIVEFHNVFTGHYFVAYDGLEARGIDDGAAGAGWERTLQSFRPGGSTPVCRFYTGGANSHFFTVEPGECELVKRAPGWIYEGLGFYATRVVNGQCAGNLRTVYRLFNNRQRFNDSNHRYIVDLALVPAMAAQGWSLEGAVFCAKP